MLGREHRQVRFHHRVPDHWGQQETPDDVFCAMKEVAWDIEKQTERRGPMHKLDLFPNLAEGQL